MANVLSDDKKQQVLALGRLGWSLRRIERTTGVRRETASVYLKAAGIAVRPPGGWGRRAVSKPAMQVTTDLYAEQRAPEISTDVDVHPIEPTAEATADSGRPTRSPTASACEPYREVIELALARGRNAMAIWQDLVSQAGFSSSYESVKRFVNRIKGTQSPEARPVIVTAPGEE